MEKISIIIPCYNVENYIDKCLESIVSQTIGLENLEIICVDDCSTDNTLLKLKEWEQRFPENIMLITYEKNLRQGGARNVGLQYATSKYVGFIDSDDWIEPEMYEILYLKMMETGVDLVQCKYIRDPGDGSITINTNQREDHEYRFENINGFYRYSTPSTGNNGMNGGITCGLFIKDIILENNVFFPESISYEDNYWTPLLRLYIGSIYIVDLVLYHYFINPNSTITTKNSLHHFDRLTTETMLIEEYIKRGVFDIFKDDFFASFIQLYWLNSLFMFFTRFDSLPDLFNLNQMKDTVYKYFPEYIIAMKSSPIDLNTSDPTEYLLNLLLVDDLCKNMSVDEIQNKYLKLMNIK